MPPVVEDTNQSTSVPEAEATPNVGPQSTMANSNSEASSIKEDNAADINPLTDFVTTSYVINSINSALNDAMKKEAASRGLEEEAAVEATEKRNFFELQKQMQDGSSRKATADEMSSQDMKNKLEQAAQLTSKMTVEQKIEWAQKQRQEGNQLYKDGKYKEAIDIYLTCLIVRDTTKETIVDDQEVLILPVMNNLAQCALQLGWYHKAEVFCTLALESLPEDSKGTSVAKLYYKRGKARRLRGWYDEAKKDLERATEKLPVATSSSKKGAASNSDESARRALERAMEKLGVTGGGGTNKSSGNAPRNKNDNNNDKSPEQNAIEKEFQLLAKAVAEGKKNKKRTQRAMQKVLGGFSPSQPTTTEASQNEPSIIKDNEGDGTQATTSYAPQTPQKTQAKVRADTTTPLYHEKQSRTHSTIRKHPEGPPPYERPRLPAQVSYWQMYRLVAARVAQRMLDIIGEEEGTGFGGGFGSDGRRPKHD